MKPLYAVEHEIDEYLALQEDLEREEEEDNGPDYDPALDEYWDTVDDNHPGVVLR